MGLFNFQREVEKISWDFVSCDKNVENKFQLFVDYSVTKVNKIFLKKHTYGRYK